MTQCVNGCRGIFLPVRCQQWYWLPETPTHSTQGLQKYISAGAKEQINLNTGFGRAKFKQQQKEDALVSEQSAPFSSNVPNTWENCSQTAIRTLLSAFGGNRISEVRVRGSEATTMFCFHKCYNMGPQRAGWRRSSRFWQWPSRFSARTKAAQHAFLKSTC